METEKKYKVGYTDGVYDLFHIGHLNMIKTAKAYCEYLIVGVHGDDVVEGYKNHVPIINENDRKRIIESVKGVDRAEINRFRDKIKWNHFEKVLAEINVDVVYVPYTQGISTTDIKKRILKS